MPPLSTTSFAVLGLLAIRPWSAYELTDFMQTSAIASIWPRAASSLYREPKLLVEHGLAEVRHEKHRGPERAVYEITDAGRAALRDWLASPATGPRARDEGMLHVSLGDHGTKRDLLAQIRAIRESALHERFPIGLDRIRERGLRFPERAHVSVLVLRYALEQKKAILRWCDWAEKEVGRWPESLRVDAKRRKALAALYDTKAIERFLES